MMEAVLDRSIEELKEVVEALEELILNVPNQSITSSDDK